MLKKNDEEVEMEKEFTVSVPMRLEHEYDKYYDTDWYYPIDMDRIDLIKYVIDNHMIPNKLGYFILEEPLDAIEITDTFPNITWN